MGFWDFFEKENKNIGSNGEFRNLEFSCLRTLLVQSEKCLMDFLQVKLFRLDVKYLGFHYFSQVQNLKILNF